MKTMEMLNAKYYFEKGIETAIEVGEEITMRHAPGNLGRVLLELGEFHKAKELFKKMIAAKPPRLSLEALWIGQLGQALRGLGKFKQARKCFEIALKKSQDAEDARWQITHLSNLADILRETGDTTQALELLQQGTALAETTNNQYGQAFCYFRLGRIYHQIKNYLEARTNYEKSLSLDIQSVQYKCAVNLGITYLHQNTEEAKKYFIQGQIFCQELLEKTPKLYDVLFHLALAELGSGQRVKAIDALQKALDIYKGRGVAKRFKDDVIWLLRGSECANLAENYEVCDHMMKMIEEKNMTEE